MITVMTQFKFPRPVPFERARGAALVSAPRHRGVPGLIRKYIALSPDGMSGVGIYL